MKRGALQKAIDNLSIQMVYLHSTEAKIYNGFDPLIPNQELIGQYNIATQSCSVKELQEETGIKHKFLVYQTEARMRYLKGPISDDLKESLENEEQLDKLIASEIVAIFVSEYAIKCDEELPQDSILEFGRINVPHQVWPYWREYCHSTCARMSLPVSILPMFVINKTTESA
ncbi:MAG: hypothetical protein ACXWTS_02375 [Methylococcaceae bacterium]